MGRAVLRIVVKLILWEMMVVATIQGNNISHRLSSGHLVRREIVSPEKLEIKYYDKGRELVINLRKVVDSTVGSAMVLIRNVDSQPGIPYKLEYMQPIFYHGVTTHSAITYFPHTETLHGVIDQSFYIENLPLTDVSKPEEVTKYLHPMSNRFSCKNELSLLKQKEFRERSDPECTQRLKADLKKHPRKTLFAEIKLVVDTSLLIDFNDEYHDRYEKVIMYVYAYWNAVDMLFRHLKSVLIQINIEAIDVGPTINVVEKAVYFDDSRTRKSFKQIPKHEALERLKYGYRTQTRIDRNMFDFLIWMTRAKLLSNRGMHRKTVDFAIGAEPTDCGGLRLHEKNGEVSNRAIIMHDDKYGDYHLAARELAHQMFVTDDDAEAIGIMHPLVEHVQNCLMWSCRSDEQFATYTRSKSSCCLRNFPYKTISDSFYPLLTKEAQCSCYHIRSTELLDYNKNTCSEMIQCKTATGYTAIGLPLDGTICSATGNNICISGICRT